MLKEKNKKEKNKKLFSSNFRRELLASTTKAESAVGRALSRLGLRFLPQYPITTPRKTYYADIYVPSLRLIIEVDGGYHETKDQKRLDDNRSANIRKLDYHLCRIKNKDAYSFDKIHSKIKRFMPKKQVLLGSYSRERVKPSQNG